MAVGSIVFAYPAHAITLIPPSLEISLTPGQTSQTIVKLFNETANTLQLYTEARNFTAQGETGQPTFDFNAEQVGLSSWVSVEKGPIVIAPNERYEVPVTISTPSDADPGGHYASLFFTSTPPEAGQIKISSKVGTLLLAKVAGDVSEQGSIAEFNVVGSKHVLNRPPVQFFARFKNTGNVHLRPTGTIAVSNMFGKVSDTIEFNAGRGATLRDSTRRYEAVWERGQVGDTAGNAWTAFWKEYGNEKNNFALGKYTAKLSVTAGTSDSVSDQASVSYWIIPWRVLLVWGIVIVIAVLLLILAIKRYNAWIVKKSKG
ncbi:MAG: hypothetical protein PHY34_00750 [Patescibacteria group bacterium]|nr:hypothetical protein [Patescibacteria group bacterium]